MPVFTAMTPESVHLGDKHIGALLAGDKLVYNRVEEWRKTTPGTLAMDIPEWASFMSIFISGGGASGGYGVNQGFSANAGGGGGGQLRLLTIDLVSNPGRRASVTVGAGGGAVTSATNGGRPGGFTRFNGWNAQSTWTASGGEPRSGRGQTDGTDDGWDSLPERESRYLNREPGARYRPQTAGRGHSLNPTSGEMGGGGGLLNGTIGGRSSGAGGDGFAIIHFFGIDPTTPRLTGGGLMPPSDGGTPSTPPDTAPQNNPESGGRDMGGWKIGVEYKAGDTVMIAGSPYRILKDHTSSLEFHPALGGIAGEYIEEI